METLMFFDGHGVCVGTKLEPKVGNSIKATIRTLMPLEQAIGKTYQEISEFHQPAWYLRRYPRLCAHLICTSLGYATPLLAADIVKSAHESEPHFCEWIHACYNGDPRPPTAEAFKRRHSHKGYMSEYDHARALVDAVNEKGDQPSGMLASWF